MTLKHIRIFVTVYQEENITRAAQLLGITQPAASLAMKELEHHYQTKLFERCGRGIRPTPAGKQLYSGASRLLNLYQEMDQEMKNWNTAGKLRVGSSISIGSCIMPRLIHAFCEKYPKLEVYVKVDSSDVIEQNILENRLDFALIEGLTHSDKLVSQVFLKDELLPICSPTHPLAGAKNVELQSLREEHFLMRESNSGTRQFADSCFAMKDFLVRPLWESTSTSALINAVAAGLGISVLPKRMLEKHLLAQEISSFTIKNMDFKRNYSLVYYENKFLSPAMHQFFDMALLLDTE
jgi:DNA-binding transcriptional LysR family regulator